MKIKPLFLILLVALIAGCTLSVQPLANRSKKTSAHRNPSVEKHEKPLPKNFQIKGQKKVILGRENK